MNFFKFFSKAKTNEAKTKDLRAPLLDPNRAEEHDKMTNQKTILSEAEANELRKSMKRFSNATPSN